MAFLTWNPPNEKLQTLFNELDQKHPEIRITTTLGSSVHFLGAYIENKRGGHFYTRVYREPTLQPYVLPYVIGHPRLLYRQWFRWALIRAVRYCTVVEDFDEERLYIELTLLANGYSLDFVKSGTTKFFKRYSTVATLEPNHLDGRAYESLRIRLIERIQQEKQHRQQQKLLESNKKLIHLHYLYEWGPRCQFNETFHKLWSGSFKNDPIFAKADLKLMLNTKHCYSSNALLAQQAPHRTTT
jgi:hypothetical protein